MSLYTDFRKMVEIAEISNEELKGYNIDIKDYYGTDVVTLEKAMNDIGKRYLIWKEFDKIISKMVCDIGQCDVFFIKKHFDHVVAKDEKKGIIELLEMLESKINYIGYKDDCGDIFTQRLDRIYKFQLDNIRENYQFIITNKREDCIQALEGDSKNENED